MKFSTTLSAVAVLLTCCYLAEAWKRSDFQCPPPESISPCECQTSPRKLVTCDDVQNVEIVQNALQNRFSAPLPSLQISNVHGFSLPHHAFSNISTRRLVLKSSNLRIIADDAFDGQEDVLGLLVLSNDRLIEFPSALKHLSGLRTLSLAGNLLMKVDEESLQGLDGLKHLVLSDNRISRIDQYAFPSSIESLSLSRNLLKTLNRTTSHLSSLEWLLLSGNRLASVRGELSGLYQLRYLHLSNNVISDVRGSFDDLEELRDLNLAFNNLRTVGDSLRSLTNLRSLNLSYNYFTEIDAKIFKNLRHLTHLDLSGNFLMNLDSVFTPLKSLRHLNLSNNDLTTLDYDCFRGLMELQELDLSHNELTSLDGISGYFAPRITSLLLQNNKLSSLNHGLKSLKDLHELDLSNNGLAFIKEHHLSHNKNLEILKLSGNPWLCTDYLDDALRNIESRMVRITGKPFCYLSENAL